MSLSEVLLPKRLKKNQKRLRMGIAGVVIVFLTVLGGKFYDNDSLGLLWQIVLTLAAMMVAFIVAYYMLNVYTTPFFEDQTERQELENWLNVNGFKKIYPKDIDVFINRDCQRLVYGVLPEKGQDLVEYDREYITFGPYSSFKTSEAKIIVRGEYTIEDYYDRFRLVRFHSDKEAILLYIKNDLLFWEKDK